MQVGTDRIGMKALSHCRDRDAEPERAIAMPSIKYNAPFTRLVDIVIDLQIIVQQGDVGGVKMRMDVARTHMFK